MLHLSCFLHGTDRYASFCSCLFCFIAAPPNQQQQHQLQPVFKLSPPSRQHQQPLIQQQQQRPRRRFHDVLIEEEYTVPDADEALRQMAATDESVMANLAQQQQWSGEAEGSLAACLQAKIQASFLLLPVPTTKTGFSTFDNCKPSFCTGCPHCRCAFHDHECSACISMYFMTLKDSTAPAARTGVDRIAYLVGTKASESIRKHQLRLLAC